MFSAVSSSRPDALGTGTQGDTRPCPLALCLMTAAGGKEQGKRESRLGGRGTRDMLK